MAKRILCEMTTDRFTGITYPVPYDGNCWQTEDSKGLQDFKKEALTKHPELKGKIKIMSYKSMDEKRKSAFEARVRNPAYQEWKAYQQSMGRIVLD